MFYSCKTTNGVEPNNAAKPQTPRILVFSKTKGFYHNSIPEGTAAIQKMGRDNNIRVDTTKNAAYFTEDSLKNYRAVIFMSTTQDVLNNEQQVAFERYIQAGGGYAGVHAAADTEYDWPWYGKLVGGWFLSHPGNPNVRAGAIDVVDAANPIMAGIPARWERTDEWYDYKSISSNIKVLAKLDESTYGNVGKMGRNHPIAWYQEFDGGRSFYTGGGHTKESFSEPLFVNHLWAGIQYAMGDGKALDYSKSYSIVTPEENRFTRSILANDLNEPMELTVTPDGRVLYVERTGKFSMYDPKIKKNTVVREFPVFTDEGNGLLGITFDPDFAQNHWLYFFHTPVPKDKNKLKQHVSRFTLTDQGLDLASEKVLLEIPIDLESSAHTGGSLTFDRKKDLFISVGDNTVPFKSDGFAPIDEIPGRHTFDAQRSAGNPNDLRGKILRIHPLVDGTYTIPEGNLFPKGTPGTRPEIYTMGCRNPYRISVDPATSIVYWGEIGPDSGKDSLAVFGPRGYDEFNQAKKAGNYGWPYFVGDSKPYRDYDFATKKSGDFFNVNAPVNNSPNNTGAKTLPPATKAMVWYPYNASKEFPILGTGGRSAMAGPVYHFDPNLNSPGKLPQFYDKGLFVYDWMRNWVMVIRLDNDNNFVRMEPFLPATGDFKRPVDMELGPDGALYVLEYGSVYGIDNDDARVVKIEFNGGNRAPLAVAGTRDSVGIAPLKVAFYSRGTKDLDEDDKITYEWLFDGKTVGSMERNPTYTYTQNGVYQAILRVKDQAGLTNADTVQIKVGNTLPEVAINLPGNQSFYWDNSPVKYAIKIADKEDQKVDPKNVKVFFDYMAQPAKNQPQMGHQILTTVETNTLGKSLIAGSDCKACHQIEKKSVGPAFVMVARRYKRNAGAVDKLATKIINGGGGNWGEHAMSAHPQVSKSDASEMVKYILSLGDVKKEKANLPLQGALTFKEHNPTEAKGMYTLLAAYTDKGGNAVGPLTNSAVITFRNPKLSAVDADEIFQIDRWGNSLGDASNGSYLLFKGIDLTNIKELTYRLAPKGQGTRMEVHIDSPGGPIVSSAECQSTESGDKKINITAPVKPTTGRHDLYFVVAKDTQPDKNLLALESIEFKK
jgi:cytochrome c